MKKNPDTHDEPDYEKKYGAMLTDLAKAAGEMTRAGDVRGVTFLIECADAILGRALVLLEAQRNKGRDN